MVKKFSECGEDATKNYPFVFSPPQDPDLFNVFEICIQLQLASETQMQLPRVLNLKLFLYKKAALFLVSLTWTLPEGTSYWYKW
jgi:hypothetical protein